MIKKFRIADRFAAYVADSSAVDQVTHMLTDTLRFCLLKIAADLEGVNDANELRSDAFFKMAHELVPSESALSS